jgi:hypothetical protein
VTTQEQLLGVLREFHRERLAMRQRHAAVSRAVPQYAFNNTYQYVLNREDVHLQWLEAAIAELGGTPENVGEPTLPPRGRKEDPAPLIREDAKAAADHVARWRPRLDEVGNARHRNMMGVILGETLEQKRFFDQMLAGRDDLLGRRANGPGKDGTGDGVVADRWTGWRG